MDTETNSFNYKLLRQRREFLDLSRLDVVKRLYEGGVNTTEYTITSWENGETTPDADKLPALAEVLKVKVHEFYA